MKKKILSICLVAVIAVMAITGASLAYLTDTDEAENTFVIGNVKIEQYEKDRNGNDFVQNQKLLPIVNDSRDANGYHLGGNYIDKIVTVKNTGSEAAYIRTHIAFPAALDDGPMTYNASANVLHWNGASATDTFGAANFGGTIENDWYWGKSVENDWPDNGGDWNCYQTTIDGVRYNVYVVTHGTAVEAEATTAPSLFGVYLDAGVNCDENGYFIMRNGTRVDVNMSNTDVLVLSEAVQAAGWDNAFTALDQAFGAVGSYNPWNK
jgi:predicted ribosomally synthesized peptide with SipW-like signal peptide